MSSERDTHERSSFLKSFQLPQSAASPSLGYPDTFEATKSSDSVSPLAERKLSSAKWNWTADAVDIFILLCSFLFIATSIVLVALVFHTASSISFPVPYRPLSYLQRIVSTLSLSITSAVTMVAGKRYVLYKVAREGLRSRRVAIYSHPSIGNLGSYLILHGIELPLLALAAAWGLAFVTGLTVNNSWKMGPISSWMTISVPMGTLSVPSSLSLNSASAQLNLVASSLCLGVDGVVGIINVTSSNINPSVGTIYYPPLPSVTRNITFSAPVLMNGLNITMQQLSSVPKTAKNLTCAATLNGTTDPGIKLWSDEADHHPLAIIVANSSDNSIFRFNAGKVIWPGTLSFTGDNTVFAPNGTELPKMDRSNNSQWAQDITSLVCNTTVPAVGNCNSPMSVPEFATWLNSGSSSNGVDGGGLYRQWSTALNMALGAYSFSVNLFGGGEVYTHNTTVTQPDARFMSDYGVYILIANIAVSVIMLVGVLRLRLASDLGPDFIHSTRLLLDPLRNEDLFNASLDTTVDALADPYILVRGTEMLLVTEQKSEERSTLRKRVGTFSSRTKTVPPDELAMMSM